MKTRLEAKLQPQTLGFISNIWHRVPPYGVENLNLYQNRPYNNNNSCFHLNNIFFITRTKNSHSEYFSTQRASEYVKDSGGAEGREGGRVGGSLVLHHVLHGGGNHGSVDERKMGSDPGFP